MHIYTSKESWVANKLSFIKMTLNLWKKTSTVITKAYKAKQIKLRDMV